MPVARCRCGARMVCQSSKRDGVRQLQYLSCPQCDARRSRLIDAEEVFRRAKK